MKCGFGTRFALMDLGGCFFVLFTNFDVFFRFTAGVFLNIDFIVSFDLDAKIV